MSELELDVTDEVARKISELVSGITARQWLEARKHFEEPAEVIAEETIAMTIFMAYLTDPSKGWDFYEDQPLQALTELLVEHLS